MKHEKTNLFFNKTINLCYGLFLKKEDQPFIIAVKEPSNYRKVSYDKIAEEVWATKISDDEAEDTQIKKTICNTQFGMLEKSFNKNTKSSIHTNYGVAKHNQAIYGGTIYTLSKYEYKEVYFVDPLDRGIKDDESDDDISLSRRVEFHETDDKIYILNMEAKASLHNGFRYIKEMLVQYHNFNLNKAYEKMIQNEIKVFTVKTDAFTVLKKDVEVVMTLLDFGDKTGKWRVSKTKGINLPISNFIKKEASEIKFSEYTNNNIDLTIEDEYDTDKLCDIFESKKRIMIRADLPGSGKSYSCESLTKRGYNILFVCPTNVLMDKYENNHNTKITGITLNKFFGFGLTENTKITKFDDSDYQVIVFDEIFFYTPSILARIKKYCVENDSKIIIATGDTDQLEPVGQISNNLNYDSYMNQCINIIFENLMQFKENKRLKTKEDKDKLKKIKE